MELAIMELTSDIQAESRPSYTFMHGGVNFPKTLRSWFLKISMTFFLGFFVSSLSSASMFVVCCMLCVVCIYLHVSGGM